MNSRRANGLLAVWLICTAVACSDDKAPGEKKTQEAVVETPTEVCGNDVRGEGEVCDGTDVGLETCVSQGFDTGSLRCNEDCSGFDTSACIDNPEPECGNNRVDEGEVCDGTELSGQTCALMGFAGGTLACNASCSDYDTSGCTQEVPACGNNVIDGTEVCDGTALGDNTCESLGLGEGTLECNEDCTALVTEGCAAAGTTTCSGPTSYRQDGLNTDLADGEPCNFDADCLSALCNTTNYHCGEADVVAAVHVGDLPLGAACDTGASCLSGYCWAGGDTWICAEVCAEGIDAETAEAGLNCTAVPADSPSAPETGAACIPKGAGYLGDSCDSGAYDCQKGACLNNEYCTQTCDPTDEVSCEDEGTVATSCRLYNSNPLFGDTYICVPDAQANTVDEGGACEFPYECNEGLECLDETCRQPCEADSDCPAESFCALDSPSGAYCMPNDARVDVGQACDFTSQCVDGAICYDAGEGGMCMLLCPNGADDCTQAGLPATCSDLSIGQSLDTMLTVYGSVDAEGALGGDDDSGERYFSKFETELEEGTKDYYIEVSRYPNSPMGDYALTVSLNGVLSGNVAIESEEVANDSRASAQTIVIGDRVNASFNNVGDTDDVDVFKVTVTAAAGDKLVVETAKAIAGVCYEVPVILLEDGESCTSDEVCENSCFPFVREGDGFCATMCSTNEDCGDGECVVFGDNGTNDGYCLPAGEVVAGTKAFGEACMSPHECDSRICTKHPAEEMYRCGAPCEDEEACQEDAGRCLAPEPIYTSACVPHLNNTVEAGGACQWTVDCAGDNVCAEGRCQPENTSSTRYTPALVEDGFPCNSDEDCVSGNCNDNYICGAEETVAAECEGCLDNGQPCNVDTECAGGVCFAGDASTFFCVDACADADATCEGEVFGITDLSCTADRRGTFGCAPNKGVGAPADPCESGFLDCESGLCWNNTFCIAECTLEDPEASCGRDASCVTYEATTEPERQLDTDLAILDASGTALASNDNIMYGQYAASWYSSVSYTNTGDSSGYVWIRVQAAVGAQVATGAYQLQVYTLDNPPPFGNPIPESELRQSAVENNDMVLAHDLMGMGFPVRVQGQLAEVTADVDYFRVELEAGQTMVVTTAEPLGFVCWPTEKVGVELGTDCRFDFECDTGVCLGTCATECTGSNEDSCEAGFECDSFTEDSRSYCFKSLKFGESCEGSEKSTAIAWEFPACPNNACFSRGEGEPQWCSEKCLEDVAGSACGALDGESYNGECYERTDGFYCVPHLAGAVAEGATCLLNADCDTGCCDTATKQCGDSNCYGEQ